MSKTRKTKGETLVERGIKRFAAERTAREKKAQDPLSKPSRAERHKARQERRAIRLAKLGERHREKMEKVLGNVGMPSYLTRPDNAPQRLNYYEMIFTMALCGLSDKQICRALSIDEETLHTWAHIDGEILTALQAGREAACAYLSKCLYMRGKGYSHPEEIVKLDKNGQWRRAWTMKHYPPDTSAIIFFLKNRAPDHWRDTADINLPDGSLMDAWVAAMDNKRSAQAKLGATKEENARTNGTGKPH